MESKLRDFKWLNVGNGTIEITPYKKIRQDIIEMIQEVYDLGEVIENSADYIFASNIALSIWNIINLVEKSYEQHNVDFATGKYLDKIMAYYGKYRTRKKSYVLDVELVGIDHTSFNADNILFNYDEPTQEFTYVREVNTSDNSTTYRIKARDYYEELTYDKVKKLDLRAREGNMYTAETPNVKIINFQQKEESDAEFKSNFNYGKTWNLENLLLKNEFIKSVNIIKPGNEIKSIFSNASNTNKIVHGQVCVILEMTNEYHKLSEEDKKPINVDIDIVISEYLNLGFQAISVPQYQINDRNTVEQSKPLNKFFEVVTQRSPRNDFIDQNITFNILKNTHGYIEFEAFAADDIKNRIEDVINLLNKKSPFYQYDKIDTLKTIELLLEVNKSKPIKWGYSQSDSSTPLVLNGTNWSDGDSLQNNTFTKDDILLNKWSIYGTEASNAYDLPTKMNFTNYIYKEQSDGTIRVLIY